MEEAFVAWLKKRLPNRHPPDLGIGDDAALYMLQTSDRIAVTTDMLSDGVDFVLAEAGAERIGRKALAVSLSDLAAMAAQPLLAVVALSLPRVGSDPAHSVFELAVAIYEGLLPLASEFGADIVGGDTNTHAGPLVICTTAIGRTTQRGPLLRSGGQAGDRLLVTGELGGSILGRHFDFRPRIDEALLLNQRFELHAAIDISDGLALDTSRLASASRCGAILDIDAVPLTSAALEIAQHQPATRQKTTSKAVEHALSDGEDFELLLAVAPDVASQMVREAPVECGLTDIGELTEQPGLWQRTHDGAMAELQPFGWIHD